MDELIGLIESARKLVADLAAKIKKYNEGIAANAEMKEALDARQEQLTQDTEKLLADQVIVSGMIDVDAQRLKNEEDARANEILFNDRKNELSAAGKKIDDRRSALDREAHDLELGRAALLKDQEQLKKDRETYKADVLKGMGIKV